MLYYFAITSITSQNDWKKKKIKRISFVFGHFSSNSNMCTLFHSFSASAWHSECVQERWQASRPAVGEHKTHSVLAEARAGHAKPHPLGCQLKYAARVLREMAANERLWSEANVREATRKREGKRGRESKMEGEHGEEKKQLERNLGPKPSAFL